MNRSDIVGYTLAEIALALLFCIIAVFGPAYARLSKQPNSVPPKEKVAEIEQRLARAAAENAQLRKEIDDSRRNLRSVAMPSCAELNKSPDWLFTAIIRGPDTYEILGRPYTRADVLKNYSAQLDQAKRDGCRLRIRISYQPGLDTSDYVQGLRRIEENFYTLKLGSGAE
jgi:hypothetical protein